MICNRYTLTDQSLVDVESRSVNEQEEYPVEDIQPAPMNEALLRQCQFRYQPQFDFWQLINTDS